MVQFASSFVTFVALTARLVAAAPRPGSASNSYDASSSYGSSNGYGSGSSDSSNSYGSGSSGSSSGYDSSNSYGSGSSYGSSNSYGSGSNYGSSNSYSSSVDVNSYGQNYVSSSTYSSSAAAYTSSVDTSTELDTSTAYSSAAYTTSAYDAGSTALAYDTTSVASYTSTAASSYNTQYGSGSSNWGSSYDSCVQQCVASFGAPAATYTASSSYQSSSTDSSSGSSSTHTIIVAPMQGVLRFVPFATNASVGDTIKFVWNANVHTVTKSSQLEICNKTSDAPFTSGIQNKSFVFTEVVNDTNPLFFYCGVPTHCQKGMFGIINPPSAVTAPTSVQNMAPSLLANSSDLAAMNAYVNMQTTASPAAMSWGNSIDMNSMPDWSQSLVMENALYTRTFLAANPDVIGADGSVNLGATSAPLTIPQDLATALAASTSSSSAAAAPASSGIANAASASTSPSASPSPSSTTSGARHVMASSMLAGVVALLTAFATL